KKARSRSDLQPHRARELGVDAILEGTVLPSGQQVRVAAQLIDARTDAHLWSEEYTREVRDVLSLQREIAGDVAHQTRLHLLAEQHSRIATPLPIDPEAHDEYLRGRYILGMMVAHLRKKFTDKRQYTDLDILAAIGHFKYAIERDPPYAMAYAGLADAHIQLGHPVWGGYSPKETLAEAKEEATKALDPGPVPSGGSFCAKPNFCNMTGTGPKQRRSTTSHLSSILTMQTHISSTDTLCKPWAETTTL